MKIKIAVVDDQNLFRQSLCLLIASIPDFDLILDVADGVTLIERLEKISVLPDVLLMDMNMPVMDGIELNGILTRKFPSIRVIVLSVHAQTRLIAKMISAGAAGYLIKNCDREELVTAVRAAHMTGYYMNLQVLHALQEKPKASDSIKNQFNSASHLSPREMQILELICKQFSSAEIAEKLFISIRTVEGHRNNLLLKTDSRNIAGLVLFAIKNHIVQLF